jgi:hypothetical protein
MKAYGGMDVEIQVPWPLRLLEASLQLHASPTLPPSIGDCVGPRFGMGNVEKGKALILLGLELRPLCLSALNQSLYGLRYIGYYFLEELMKTTTML